MKLKIIVMDGLHCEALHIYKKEDGYEIHVPDTTQVEISQDRAEKTTCSQCDQGEATYMTQWDVYACDGGHKIIVEHKAEWPDDIQDVITCNICQEIAVYTGSVERLAEVEEKRRRT